MADKPPTPPAKPLVWPANCREVTGVPMAIIGADHLRPRPPKPTDSAPSPAPAPAPPEGAKPPTRATDTGPLDQLSPSDQFSTVGPKQGV